MAKDDIYTTDIGGDFQFNAQVAEVFPDMINRSVPCYGAIMQNLPILAQRFITSNSNVYDLGCSLGAVTYTLRQALTQANQQRLVNWVQQAKTDEELLSSSEFINKLANLEKHNINFYAVDTSEPMLSRAKDRLEGYYSPYHTEFIQADVNDVCIVNASMVVMNFVLQFVVPEKRQQLLAKIYAGLNPGGVLVLSEKFKFDDPEMDDLLVDLHLDFKRANGYSELEIQRKRTALENVMILNSHNEHVRRLERLGFKVAVWQQGFNFCSFLCVKPKENHVTSTK